jgi:hypothetical protein
MEKLINKLDLWEQDNQSNRIDYREFYPAPNKFLKEVLRK